MAWFESIGADSDVVVSSRIRLARNINGYPFPSVCSDEQRSALIEEISRALAPARLKTLDPAAMSRIDRQELVEKHLISPEFAGDEHPRALLCDESAQLAVMICEEDHVRMQAIFAGNALKEAYAAACRLDDLLDESLSIAYSESLGYLTHCPTNLGTAMRASVMLHLPALTISGKLSGVMRSLAKLGITVRGIYGEGSESSGALYQISNSLTLGMSEEEIIGKLEDIVAKIIETERKLRDSIKSDSYARICDRVMRAKGVLTNAYLLDEAEFMQLWSDVRLGVSMGFLEGIPMETLNTLMIGAQSANIMKNTGAGEDTPKAELSVLRASLARDKFAREKL